MAEPPSPPANFDPGPAFEGVHWYHDWEMFKGVRTPGRRKVSFVCKKAGVPADLTGKRVLDIGAWHGCFGFECERRGASEVIAYSLENPDVTGFNRLKELREFELHPTDQSNWFGPNIAAVIESFDTAGFRTQHSTRGSSATGLRSGQPRCRFLQ
jgi:hypothetical protein